MREEELIRLSQSGDWNAFEVLLESYRTLLSRTGYLTTRGRVRLNCELSAGSFSYSESVRQPYLASHEHLGCHRRRLSQHGKNRLPKKSRGPTHHSHCRACVSGGTSQTTIRRTIPTASSFCLGRKLT